MFISVADLLLATGDIAIQVLAPEIAAMEGGKEFLAWWDKVYFFGSLMTGLASLGPLLQSGARLLLKASGKALEQLVPMLKYALLGVRNLPRFAKEGFYIILHP